MINNDVAFANSFHSVDSLVLAITHSLIH